MTGTLVFDGGSLWRCSRRVAAAHLGRPTDPEPEEARLARELTGLVSPVGPDLARTAGWHLDFPPRHPVDLSGPGGWRIRFDAPLTVRRDDRRAVLVVAALDRALAWRRATAEGLDAAAARLVDQAQLLMAATRRPRALAAVFYAAEPMVILAASLRGQRRGGECSYQEVLDHLVRSNRADFQELRLDTARVASVLAWYQRIHEAIGRGRVPSPLPDDVLDCRSCPYRAGCQEAPPPTGDLPRVLTPVDDPGLGPLIGDYAVAYHQFRVAERRRQTLAQRLVNHLLARRAHKAVGPEGTFSLIHNRGRKVLDKNRIPPDIYAAALVATRPFHTTRFTPAKVPGTAAVRAGREPTPLSRDLGASDE
ncbi:MAG: hypothetical protein KKC37_14470 [Proteobacteria bacterium]|nr:hypothetical protein [Pseudomonadota bacterium]